MIDAEQLMSIPQIVDDLKITRVAVHRAMERGDLPPVRIGERSYVLRADVEKFIPRAYGGRAGSKPKGRAGNKSKASVPA